MKGRLVYLVVFLLLSVLLFNAVRTGWSTLQAGGRVELLATEVQELQDEKDRLEKEKAYRESDLYIEQEARDNLHLANPGDVVVILEEQEMFVADEVAVLVDERPIPEQWLVLFLGQIGVN